MPEVARTLAFLSAVLLVTSVAVWAKWLRGPLLQRLDGPRASNAAPAALVLKLRMAAFGVSAVAAVLAIGGWISP
jgi:Zn-dependent protease